VVKLERRDAIAIVTVDSPPVNALSAAVRGGIFECMKSAIADAEVKAIVLTCGGRTFIAGADITEFGKPPKPPALNDVLSEIENSPKPVVAAIHGTALGGGLEVALACHFRVAVKEAKLGLPEVKLGLIPGAGGTQRLPRLVGRGRALDIMLTARQVPADEAYAIGLVDRLAKESARDDAIALAEELVKGISLPAQLAVVRTVDAADDRPMTEGMQYEADQEQGLFEDGEAAEGIDAFVNKRKPAFG
jgi:3-hydroxyacyl-CoA dehydrogenase